MKQIFTILVMMILGGFSYGQTCNTYFTYEVDESTNTVTFTDQSYEAQNVQPIAWNWQINGVSYDTQNLTYTYTSLPFVACLTATFADSCESNYCDTVYVESTDPCEYFSAQVNPEFAFVSEAGACDGELTAYASNGTSPYSYDWSNGGNTATATALCEGTYTVTVLDANGCSITAEGYVVVDDSTSNQNLITDAIDSCITFTVVDAYISNVVITDSTTLEVEWTLVDDQQVSHIFVLTYNFSGQYGDYNAIITITCPDSKSTSQSWNQIITVDENTTTGINLILNNSSELNIYPNPVKDILTIEGENISTVEIIDINGRVVKTINNIKSSKIIDISSLNQGIYFIKTGNTVQKLVKL